MSLKKVKQVKTDKGFKIFDLIVYAALSVVVAVLFIVVFVTRDDSPLKGIQIFVRNEIVYEYDFTEGQKTLNEEYTVILSDDAETITLRINTGGDGYNIVRINKAGSVKVTEANCDRQGQADCVYTPELRDSSGAIYCSPHGLRIVPFDFDIDGGTVII